MGSPLGGSSLGLTLLTPKYDEKQHGAYLTEIEAALRTPAIRNIAVTGSYGAGKSSVLGEVTRRFSRRVVEISLSSVGTDGTKSGTSMGAASDTLNPIQKELVKQLLYRERPSRLRSSRFERIHRLPWWTAVLVAIGVGVGATAVLYETNWANRLASLVGDGVAGYGALFLLVTAVGLPIARWAQGRISPGEVKTQFGSITLDRRSSTYFDQYLDEIVYFFEISRRDVVIIEDLDRFDDVAIYESLRALNTLINSSEQVHRRRRRWPDLWRLRLSWHKAFPWVTATLAPVPQVKFVYALKDSVFESLEAERANRTKFFDLVVPIVPFITHRNARDMMTEATKGMQVSKNLVSLAARHVADQRLIDNISNEYKVFAKQLITNKLGVPGLAEDSLFSMILYKNVYLRDFEDMRLGNSKLDELHKAYRSIVDHNTADAKSRADNATRHLSEAMEARAERLGMRLTKLVSAIDMASYGEIAVAVDGRTYPASEFTSPLLWKAIASASEIHGGTTSSPRRITFIKDRLASALGDNLDPATWDEEDHASWAREISRAGKDHDFLRHCTWEQLYQLKSLKATIVSGTPPECFQEVVARLLGPGLAAELVSNGYIDDYYAFYMSQYYGTHASKEAWSFMVRTIDRGETNLDFPLTAQDVQAVLDDRGPSFLEDPRTFNHSVLSFLLDTDNTALLGRLVGAVSAWTNEGRQFVSQFIAQHDTPDRPDLPESEAPSDDATSPDEPDDSTSTVVTGSSQAQVATGRAVKLVALLSPRLTSILTFVAHLDISSDLKTALLDAGLAHQNLELRYATDQSVVELALGNYLRFQSLTNTAVTLHKTTTMAALAGMGVRLPTLEGLNNHAKTEAIRLGNYAITGPNIVILTGQKTLSLDSIRAANRAVYDTVIGQLGDYLAGLDRYPGEHPTVSKPTLFSGILNELDPEGDGSGPGGGHRHPNYDQSLREIVLRSAPKCRVDDLKDVPASTWGALCHSRRTRPTVTNILAYLELYEEVDGDLGKLLVANRADLVSKTAPAAGEGSVPEADRQRIALALINAKDGIPSPQARASLAAGCHPAEWIPVEDIVPETGDLPGLLIKKRLIEDAAAAFTCGLMPDWPTREYAIACSKEIDTFISPEVVPASELAAFFRSTRVKPETKRLALDALSTYPPTRLHKASEAIAKFALDGSIKLDTAQLNTLQTAGLSDDSLARLLVDADLPLDDLLRLLRGMSTPYQQLADSTDRAWRLVQDTPEMRSLAKQLVGSVIRRVAPWRDRIRVDYNKDA